MIVVYIAGPFRAETPWGVEQNVRRAEALCLGVWKAGMVGLCVHSMCRHFEGEAADEVWLHGELEILTRCDAVLLVEGWEKSSGTLAEIREAKARGIQVFRSLETLRLWAKGAA